MKLIVQIKIPWTANFTQPTVISIESVQVVLCNIQKLNNLALIKKEDWDFLDFISFDAKISQIKKFAINRLAELQEAFTKDEKSAGYFDRVMTKVLDNLHLNIKNIHIRIEEPKNLSYSLGLTLEEIFIVNTNEKWEQIFIDRNKQKNINVFKLLKISNLGIYLKTKETYIISNIEDKAKIRTEMDTFFPLKAAQAMDIDYLVKPSK